MKANYNVTGNDRKALVAAIENLTGRQGDLHAYADLQLTRSATSRSTKKAA